MVRQSPRRQRARQGAGLRAREAARARRGERGDQHGRAGDRHALLHGARAGARRAARRARGHLQPRRDAVPRADGRAAVRRAVAHAACCRSTDRSRRAAAQPRARAARCRSRPTASCCARWRRPSTDRYASAADVQERSRARARGAGRRAESGAAAWRIRRPAGRRAAGEPRAVGRRRRRPRRGQRRRGHQSGGRPSARLDVRRRSGCRAPGRRRLRMVAAPSAPAQAARSSADRAGRRRGAAAFAIFAAAGKRSDGVEHEPNNTPGYANLLPRATRARRDRRADQRTRARRRLLPRSQPGRDRASLHARLEGIPGVDLVLELFDAQGRRHRQERRARAGPRRMAAADVDRADRGVPGGARGLDRRHAADGERARSLHADRALGAAPARAGSSSPTTGPRPRRRCRRARACAATWAAPRIATGSRSRPQDGAHHGHVDAPAGVDVIVFRDEDGKKVDQQARRGRQRAVRARRPRRASRCSSASRESSTARSDPKDQALQGLEDPYELGG